MAYIGRQLARGENKLFDDISSSFNGSTTVFNLTVSSVATSTATPFQLFVSLGGVMQKPNTDFTTAGNQITFTTAPAAGLSCWIMMQGDTIDQAAIPDASVTPSKISGSNFAFSGDLRLKDADGSHYVGFASPSTVASNKVWTLPAADGSANQVLRTNGSGILSWATDSTVTEGTAVLSTGESSTNKYLRTDGDGTCSWQTIDTSTYMLLTGGTFTGDVTFDGATAGYDIVWDKSDNALEWADNAKAKFGTGGDLEIFHNASNSVINDAGTGDLLLQVGGSTKATVSSTGFDITGALTVSTNATITGNLTVSGTTTTINTQTLDVEDKNVVIGKVSSPSDTTADGGGWTLKGATDKTFNWVNATDAWTSSEHIHLIDNKKLFVGGASGTTDGLEIVHNASDSILNDTGTGALKLQLGGSTKLEVTSGGINVTGAISVGGAPLASGNTVDLVADGAIAAGKAVIIKSNGKAAQVQETDGLKSTITTGGSRRLSNQGSGSDCKYTRHTFDTQNGTYLTISRYDNMNGAVRVENFGRNSNGNLTVGNILNLFNPGSPYAGGSECQIQYLGSGKSVAIYMDNNNNQALIAHVITGAQTSGTPSAGSGTAIANGVGINNGITDFSRTDICRIDNTKFVVAWTTTSGGTMKLAVGTISGTSVTMGTVFQASEGGYSPSLAWDSTNSRLILVYNEQSSMRYHTFTISGTTLTNVQAGQTAVSSTSMGGVTYLSTVDKFVMGYTDGSGSEPVKAVVGTLNTGNGTVAWGTALTISGTEKGQWPKLCPIEVVSGAFAIIYENDDQNRGDMKTAVVSGTSITSLSNRLEAMGNPVDVNVDISYNSTDKQVGVSYRNIANSSQSGTLISTLPVEGTSNLTNGHTNCVGFAEDAISDGNTGTIKTLGNVVGNQSGLSAGSTYYVDNDGTLSSGGHQSLYGGLALSSSTLLIQRKMV
jgi:hypothetical protein